LRILAVRCGARLKTIKINHAAFNISNFGSYLIPLDEYKFTTHISRIAIHSFVVLCLLVVACKSCKYGSQFPIIIIIIIIIRSTTSLCIYGLLYHLLYVYLYDRWFPEPRARVKAGYRTCPNNVALPSCPRLASNGIVDKISLGCFVKSTVRRIN
jgi:hypothetical protein